MSGKPAARYGWATSPNYASGGAVGTPTRSAPSSTEQSEGFHPGDKPTAQILGALIGNLTDWVQYIDENRIDGSLAVGGAPLSFTSFTFTATSGTPGLITATAHARQTGDGPVRVSNSGGGLPGGLAAGTDYWVIVVDANTLRLATSRANALSSVPVTLSSNGTGTQTLAAGTGCVRLGDVTVTRSASVAGTFFAGGPATIGGSSITLASRSFTADNTTEKLAITDHGLVTGDGPLQVTNSGGALPVPLVPATNYWAITVDASHIQLAFSLANALIGAAINLTTNGTGTSTIASVGATRPADAIVTGNLTASTLAVGPVTASSLVTASAGVTAGTNQDVTLQGTGTVRHGTWTKIIAANANGQAHSWITIDSSTITAWEVQLDSHFQAGDVITAIRVNVTDNVTGPTRAQAAFKVYTDGNGTPSTLAGPTATSGTAGTLQQIPLNGLNEDINAGKAHTLQVLPTGGSAAITLWSIEVDWRR